MRLSPIHSRTRTRYQVDSGVFCCGSVVQAHGPHSTRASGHNGRMWNLGARTSQPDGYVNLSGLCELVGKVLTEAAASEESLASSFQFSSQYPKLDGIDDSAVRHGRMCGRTTVNSAFVRAVRPGYPRFVDSIFEALPPTRRNPGPRQPIRSLSRVWTSRRPVMCPRSG